MIPPLKSAIETLYEVFGKYTSEDLYFCDCGCTDEADVKKLTAKPLRELMEDALGYYQFSAMYTIGGLEHYKHFLPRIFELASLDRMHGIGLDEIHYKLDYAKWTEWEASEVEAINDFVLWDWVDRANHGIGEVNGFTLSAYSDYLGLPEVIKLWRIADSEAALRNFVVFFFYHGNKLLAKGLKVNEKRYQEEFLCMIREEGLMGKLEETFFTYETTDSEYAEKASVVLQMIEQFSRMERSE